MTFTDPTRRGFRLFVQLFRAPEDEAGGGQPPANGGDEPPADGGNVPPANGGNEPPANGGNEPPADGGTARWWEDKRFSDDARRNLTALGLTVDDPLEAVKRLNEMEVAAKRRLGAGADQLLQKPKEGQDVAEWLRENGETFGIPKDAEAYEVERPESWPKDAEWNSDLEAEARKIAHEEGLSGKALNRFVGLYAGAVQSLISAADADLENANSQMMTELKKDWGLELNARLTLAQQASSVLAQRAGLSREAMDGIAQVLRPGVGDAGTIRLFAAIGEMMGEDTMESLSGGGGGLGTTPPEARQQLEKMQSEGGEWFEASKKGDRAAIAKLKPTMERLAKIAAS